MSPYPIISRASRMRVPFTMDRRSSKLSTRYGTPVLATSHIRSKEKDKCGWVERISYDTLPMVKGRRYNVDSSVTSCLKVSHCLIWNLTLRSSRNTFSADHFCVFNQLPLPQFPLAKKTGST